MKKAELHPKEKERIESLYKLEILDSIAEKEFDEITQIAAQICETPIALISLIDKDRQWFKSKVGLKAEETHRDFAFCAHAILQDDVFTVSDSLKDARFFDNPLVTAGPSVQFYAGAPILSPGTELPIGTLCVIDNKPRDLSESKKKSLLALSNQVNRLLQLRVQISELKTSNRKLIFKNTAFDNMSEGVTIQNRSGEIIDFNKAALTVLGLSADQLKGKTLMEPDLQSVKENGDAFPRDQHPAVESIRLGKTVSNVTMGIYSKKENVRWLLISSTPLFLDEAEKASHSVTTFADITERKKYLNILFHTSNMASLGEMAGGIAHEINTPLAIIGAATAQLKTLMSQEPLPIEKVYNKLDKVASTNDRISKIVRGLKTISRDSRADPAETVAVKNVILDSIQLCQEKFLVNDIKLTYELPEDIHVTINPTQLSQVVINLLNNAFDAVNNLKNKWIQIIVRQDGGRVKILFLDSGVGIDESIQLKIMQPFFTTKEVGKGSGLGLSLSRSIVEKFSGKLNYELVSGHTCFTISLPLAEVNSKGVAV